MPERMTRACGLAALLCMILAWTAVEAVAQASPLPQTITDAQGRFTMAFPADWEVATRAEGMIVLLGQGPVAAGSRPTVNVVVEPLTEPMSAHDYAVAAERLVKATLHNYKVIQESDATVLGRPVYYRYLTWEANTGVKMYQLQLFLTDGQTGFVVTGSTIAQRERILHDMPLVQRIMQTFRIVSSTD